MLKTIDIWAGENENGNIRGTKYVNFDACVREIEREQNSSLYIRTHLSERAIEWMSLDWMKSR